VVAITFPNPEQALTYLLFSQKIKLRHFATHLYEGCDYCTTGKQSTVMMTYVKKIQPPSW